MTLDTPIVGPAGESGEKARPRAEGAPATTAPRRPAAGVDLEAATDRELVTWTRRGDLAAGDLLARRCRRPAYLLALQLMRNPDDALDVSQDAMLRFFSTLDRIKPGRPVRPWLYAIVRNRARDLMRRRPVRRPDPIAADDPEAGVELISAAPRPDADAERSELQRRVWRALALLSEDHREILVLRDYQDLSYEEIAAVLKIPMGTVMSRLHRARKALRDELSGGEGTSPP